ncbi:MAG TPA: rhomboid family intramembrane serine protease [Bacteroidales bacterium]|nr:rhomboid family intramembrane serine protease [Bacteroidales bacterium]HQH19248.1 rhomboid family intramembrane serine protease [Bacteroidales bacterium]HQI45517.1 rhomboid family intramembrane serine protease [Bacteroidales bacterium]
MEQYSPTGFRILPPVVKNILIVNGLFFLATISLDSAFNIDLIEMFGMHYFKSEYFKPHQIITYMFMHGGFTHILFNMFAVWMFGSVLENFWGPKRFLTFYVVTGIGAILIQMLINYYFISSAQHAIDIFMSTPSPELFQDIINNHFDGYVNKNAVSQFISDYNYNTLNISYINEAKEILNNLITARMNIPTVGASGSVFGLLLAFGMLFPNTLIYVYFAIPVKAKWFVIIYGAIELYSGIANNPGDNVAHFAHLGGMLFGFLMIIYWNKKMKNNYF